MRALRTPLSLIYTNFLQQICKERFFVTFIIALITIIYRYPSHDKSYDMFNTGLTNGNPIQTPFKNKGCSYVEITLLRRCLYVSAD